MHFILPSKLWSEMDGRRLVTQLRTCFANMKTKITFHAFVIVSMISLIAIPLIFVSLTFLIQFRTGHVNSALWNYSSLKQNLCWLKQKLISKKMTKKCSPSPARYVLPPLVGFSNHDIRKNRMPAYSFGLRLHDKAEFTTPAPNAYKLPSIIGGHDKTFERAPAHSLHKRLSTKEAFHTPAPNAYSLQNFKPGTRAPAYTMGAKLQDPSETIECWSKILVESISKSKIIGV